jgi:monovalent cation:H+ antiporter-2, CPA2 family
LTESRHHEQPEPDLMHDSATANIILDLVLAVVAAFAGGLLAQRLKQPVILGYLLAGVVLGPFTPGPTAHTESVGVLAEIGVAFLMFSLGAEVPLRELRRLGRITAVGGPLQILLTMGLGPLVAPALNLSPTQGVFLGGLIALSSTVVALKVLMERGELGTVYGRTALGILIAQDLAVVPMVVVLPSLALGSEGLAQELLFAALKAGGVLAGAFILGTRVVPWLLAHAATGRSRELFLLGVVGLALGTALVTQTVGLSLAFGAFLAGLVVAESEYRTQVVAEVLPMRDLFASLFFVSVGMLVNPTTLLAQIVPVLVGTLVVLVVKTVVTMMSGLAVGMPARVALLAGVTVAQVGEFSFVLAQIGVDRGAIPQRIFDLTLAVALATIILTPSMVYLGPRLIQLFMRFNPTARFFADPVRPLVDEEELGKLTQHTVICGYGRVARQLVEALTARGLRYVVVEYNPLVVQALRKKGVPVIYGDASNPAVLEHVHLEHAKALAILMPDADAAEVAVRNARAHHQRLDIIVRARSWEDIERLRRAGASDVVQPEFEAGVEVIRHTLRHYGITGYELTRLVAGRRETFYRAAPES